MQPEFNTPQNMSNVKTAETTPQPNALLHHSSLYPYTYIARGFALSGIPKKTFVCICYAPRAYYMFFNFILLDFFSLLKFG